MTQNDRDFQKVLQALTAFDKKLSTLEDVVKNIAEATTNYASSQQNLNKEQSELNRELAEANVNYATSQQELNKEQSELNKDLGQGIKMLGDNLAEVIQFLQKIGGNN